MKSLIRGSVISLLAISISTFVFSQNSKTKKYLRRTKKVEAIHYGDSAIYSRGLYNDSTRLFIGNSDGSMYYLNLDKEKPQLIFKMPKFTEIRDIERSGDHLIAMHSGENGKLILLKLNGSMRQLSYPMWKGVFLDGLDFYGDRGFLMGDPVDGYFSLYHTIDQGETWYECDGKVAAYPGEAGFAASGTNVQILNDSTYVFVSGGTKSYFYKSKDRGKSWSSYVLPYYPGESTGAYSICFGTDSSGVIVGGDYKDAGIRMNTCFYTTNAGDSWLNAMETPRGYRSCVYFKDGIYYACGRNGIDFSLNGGRDWIPFADGSYYTLSSTRTHLIATTKHGAIKLFDLITNED